ncbi:T9SS type A sorting domain-containing protein [Flavobacterium hercynium]|uniref:Secretion system C-terminal sorting domain-containing protein n=1 Tax=Flavobacterium hercynium TaxID=387094 RepID=A0A226HII3_9FLAO|nr:T9SS type A sorting domain-containing protein [Flavobacterium hercynium]OXA93972.1 hypothetical protein B0A66_05585 [Flavobacterium hercynium]SMP36615.1 Por secretion system C-terminal sorting domain-containing protein [Flavobacterium hercynium]
MKKIYLLIILLVTNFGFAQVEIVGKATYRTEVTVAMGNATADGCTGGGLGYLYLSGIGAESVLKNDNDFWEDKGDFFTRDYTDANLATHVALHTRRRTRSGGCSVTQDLKSIRPIVINQDITYKDYNSDKNPDGIFAYLVHGTLRVNSFPKIDLVNTDPVSDIIGTESSLVIPQITGVAPQYFDWMYHIEGDDTRIVIKNITIIVENWHPLPAGYQGKNSLNIKCKDFLPDEAVGKKIYLRASEHGTKVILLYNLSAPHILSVEETETRCFDTNDGSSIKINFSRPLEDNEKLSLDFDGTFTDDITNITNNGRFPSGMLERDNSYTVRNLPKGISYLKLFGFFTRAGVEESLYIKDPEHQRTFEITSPTPVDFSIAKKNDVLCYGGGQDGAIIVTATGGTTRGGLYQCTIDNGATWQNFSNGAEHTITGLSMGICYVKVRRIKDANDTVGCVAKSAGNEKQLSLEIGQPAAPVSLFSSSTQQPTFYGGTNGSITASVTGGTPIAGNSYSYEWRNSKDEVISNTKTTTQFGGGLYAITLQGIPADTYKLTVWDANHGAAVHKEGCTIVPVNIVVIQPDPIVVTLSIQKTISCNVTNQFGNESDMEPVDGQRDESQDGILTVNVTGGVPFTGFSNGGLPYKYFWKKQQQNGAWTAINDDDATIEHLSHGNYSVNVEDKNGIRLGDYVDNILTVERDSIQFMQQPDKLELTFTKEDIFCSQGNNGWAKTHVTGGTAPYKYQWSNGKTTADLAGLNTGNYFVQITDAKGCVVQGSILIEQPNGVAVNENIKNPTCYQGNDGAITLAPTGGVQPYEYRWSTGANTQSLSNLTAGKYTITLTDAQGCILIQDFELTDPAPIVIDLGPDRTLCYQQVLDLDASISGNAPRYEWTSTNGFTSDKAKVSVTNAGTYHVKVTSDLGCIGEDEIEVATNDTIISSEFLLSTQAYLDEEIILVNTSSPRGESTKWITPEGAAIVEEKDNFITLKFKDLGTYTVSLQQTQGDCYAIFTKSVMIEKRSIMPNAGAAESSFIKDFIVTPNPSDGNFKVIVNLENNSTVNLRLFTSNGQNALLEKKESGKKEYEIDFNATLASGIYILVLETGQQTLVKKIIIY